MFKSIVIAAWDSHIVRGLFSALFFICPALYIFKWGSLSWFFAWIFVCFWAVCMTCSHLVDVSGYKPLLFSKDSVRMAKSLYDSKKKS